MVKINFIQFFLFISFFVSKCYGGQLIFTIERSTNKNILHYDANIIDGHLNWSKPIEAYWIMNAEHGQKEKLNWVEKHEAYGFTIKRHIPSGTLELLLKAYHKKHIKIYLKNNKPYAMTIIANRRANLQKIYIQLEAGTIFPKVEYVKLYGSDIHNNKQLKETVRP